jgi:hypothetical protein
MIQTNLLGRQVILIVSRDGVGPGAICEIVNVRDAPDYPRYRGVVEVLYDVISEKTNKIIEGLESHQFTFGTPE